MKKIILSCIKRIEASMKEDEATCIVEEFYKERNERKRKNDPTWKYFSGEYTIYIMTLVNIITIAINDYICYAYIVCL